MRNRKEYLCAMLIPYSLFCTNAYAADFPPKNAIPISVPVYFDKRPMGMAQMLIMPDTQFSFVQAAPLLAILKNLVPEERLEAMKAATKYGFLSVKDGPIGGVNLRFDEVLVALVITIQTNNKKQRSLRVRSGFDVSNKVITPPSSISAFLNIFGAQNYVDSGPQSQHQGRQPFRTSTDGALNVKGWVLEGSGNYIENNPQPWQRGNIRLVHDLPDRMMRTALGDLSYPVEGFQNFQPILGMTIARNFDLQPYRVSEPTGNMSFLLNSPSRVDIYVNNRKVRSFQLDSGPFNISDFPVINGSNDVKLVITDATGRVEVKNVDIVSNTNLLAAGYHKFAYNIGVLSNPVSGNIEYNYDAPVLSAFHRYGLTDSLTLGGNLQAYQKQQMTGFDATIGSKWGVFRADLAGSHLTSDVNGFAWQTQYQITDHGKIEDRDHFKGTKNFRLSASYLSSNFAPLGLLLPNNGSSYQLTMRYTQQWSPTVTLGIGGGYKIGRGIQPDDWNYTLSLEKKLSDSVYIGANLEQRSIEGYGAFLYLSWTPRNSRHSINGSYDSFSNTARTDWNYVQEGRAKSISASAGVVRTKDRYASSGGITYFDERGEVTASHDIVTPLGNQNSSLVTTESFSELRFASAIVYGGGHVALSRPVSNSFVIFAPDPSIEKYPIGINPQGRLNEERTYEAMTDNWGPVVLPDLSPYLYRTVRVDASEVPPGFDAGDSTYTFYPTYRSGAFVRLGSDANVLLDGMLQYTDKTPVALQAGSIRLAGPSDAADSETFFTNRSGRFRIEKLKPGQYVIELYNFPGITLPLTVPKGAAGPTQAGTLIFPVTREGVEPAYDLVPGHNPNHTQTSPQPAQE